MNVTTAYLLFTIAPVLTGLWLRNARAERCRLREQQKFVNSLVAGWQPEQPDVEISAFADAGKYRNADQPFWPEERHGRDLIPAPDNVVPIGWTHAND